MQPRKDIGFVENFLNMILSDPLDQDEQTIPKIWIEMLEMLFIIYAECELDSSTATVRMVGSTQANPYAAIAAGVASLKGTLHGGSIE